MKNKELDNTLDQVTNGIRSERIDETTVSAAKERVSMKLSEDALRMSATRPQDAGAPMGAAIEGCADFQSLIPAYLGGKLSAARSLLLVDHTHECIPCRRALKQAREARVATVIPAVRKRNQKMQYSLRPVVLRWEIAKLLGCAHLRRKLTGANFSGKMSRLTRAESVRSVTRSLVWRGRRWSAVRAPGQRRGRLSVRRSAQQGSHRCGRRAPSLSLCDVRPRPEFRLLPP